MMGVIICQNCGSILEHFEEEKVTTLYGACKGDCECKNNE
jgi:hypothetical protein